MIVAFVLLKLSCPKLYIILYKMLLIYIKLYPIKRPLKIKNPVKLVLYRVLSGVGENVTHLMIPYFKRCLNDLLSKVTDFTTSILSFKL
jgi:hypothetical protein